MARKTARPPKAAPKTLKHRPVDKATWRRWLDEKGMQQKELGDALAKALNLRPDETRISQLLSGHAKLSAAAANFFAIKLEKSIDDVLVVFGVTGAKPR